MTDKNEIRKLNKNRRSNLKKEEIDCAESKIIKRLLPILSAYKSVFIYLSFGNEVPTGEIITALTKAGKTIAVPFLKDGKMYASKLTDSLVIDGYGILEPKTLEETEVDVAVMPLLAVDINGNRVGYGKGYYDTFLSDKPAIKKIGICYDFQIVDKIEARECDVPLDIIISDEKTIRVE